MAGNLPLRVARIIPETPDALTLILEPLSGIPLRYRAGQFLTLRFPTSHGETRRSFSFSSAPGTGDPPSLTIKRKPNGAISRHILERVREGDILEGMEPSGMFTLELRKDRPRDIFMIGAGIGITPLFSHLKTLLAGEPEARITLLYSNTRRQSIIFSRQLENLGKLHPSRFTCLHILSQSGTADPVIRGHLNNGLLEKLVRSYLQFSGDRAEFLTCGPPAYMRMVLLTLRYLGFNESQIHRENFVVLPPPPPSPELGHSHQIRIRIGDATRVLQVAPFQNILQAALDQGVRIPYSCQGGVCSTCRCRLLKGKINMTANEVLTDRDLREGWILTCTGYPVSDGVEIRLEG